MLATAPKVPIQRRPEKKLNSPLGTGFVRRPGKQRADNAEGPRDDRDDRNVDCAKVRRNPNDKGKATVMGFNDKLLKNEVCSRKVTFPISDSVTDQTNPANAPSFSLGFAEECSLPKKKHEDGNVGGDVNADDQWVDSLFSDGLVENLSSSLVSKTVLKVDKSPICDMVKKSSTDMVLAAKESRIKELEAALDAAKEKALRLQNDLDVKDKVREAELRKSNLGFMEAARDTIDALRADVIESRQVQDRLGGQNMAGQKRIKLLEEESWQFKDTLSLEIAKTMKLVTDYAGH